MAKMTVGGRPLELDKVTVERKMRGLPADTIQKHVVEIEGKMFPPKQVLAEVTGWERRSFTTAEAQRVLTKLGFICRDAGMVGADGRPVWLAAAAGGAPTAPEDPRIVSFTADDGWWAHFMVDEGKEAGTWTLPIIGWAVVEFAGLDGGRKTQIEAVVLDHDHQVVTIEEYCRVPPHPRFALRREEQHPEGPATG